jgi:nicotinate phosphoribosyltransferase
MNNEQKKYSVLLTDLYQLTMAYGYWKNQVHEREAVFHLFFRKNPFQSGFSVACGLADVIDYIETFRFDEDELAYLSTLAGNDGQPLFDNGFLGYLRELRFTCDIDAISEGTLVFPHEPLVRVRGPIIQCQLLETALLNIVNFQTLIATKAARICHGSKPGRSHRWLRGDFKRPRRHALRNSSQRDPRPQLGHVFRYRGRSL